MMTRRPFASVARSTLPASVGAAGCAGPAKANKRHAASVPAIRGARRRGNSIMLSPEQSGARQSQILARVANYTCGVLRALSSDNPNAHVLCHQYEFTPARDTKMCAGFAPYPPQYGGALQSARGTLWNALQ